MGFLSLHIIIYGVRVCTGFMLHMIILDTASICIPTIQKLSGMVIIGNIVLCDGHVSCIQLRVTSLSYDIHYYIIVDVTVKVTCRSLITELL